MGRIDDIKRRAEAATEGPWEEHNWDVMEKPHVVAPSEHDGKKHCDGHFDVPLTPEDADFIAHSREDIPWLVKGLEALAEYMKLIEMYVKVSPIYHKMVLDARDRLSPEIREMLESD